MENIFKTELIRRFKTNFARVTQITTPHVVVITLAFMPVSTHAFVNHLTPHDLTLTNSQIILAGANYPP
ncbi:queuine tRNA-ribosyltransferase family protein [Coxiella-like endosymbiont of Rhipicephalus sanguineus]|uniref:queuine tRNA-ribosyltransferase family protein n=1 Tax=Coxiella-like endosymbiont of Rhipicephalus sanguineus TaxID=1955402 RepID=UPI00203D9A16|nr:queuine tRNA-ribosyltransferase family protein [Coxiella-like endosymbiont of Rhipicephalus sanguineus]